MPVIDTSQTSGGVLLPETLAMIKAMAVNPTFATLTLSGLLYESTVDLISAAGTNQAGATLLTKEMTRVTTAANAAAPFNGVALPASAAGLTIIITNHSGNPIQVYGLGADTIDDVAAATGVTQMNGSVTIFCCHTAGGWYSNGIGTGFAGQFPTVSYTNGITAFSGGGQASAVLLATVLNRVTTVAAANDSVKLPIAAPGMSLTVANAAAANSLNLFPNTGDAINAGAANAAFAIPAGKTASLYCMVAGFWHSVLSA